MNPARRQIAIATITAAIDIEQPEEIALLSRVRVSLAGRSIEGTVVGRTCEEYRRYDVRADDGRIYPDEQKGALTVIALPDPVVCGRVLT